MPEAFLSEIRIFSFDHAPDGWALCNGQLLPIDGNQALFALLGTTYGGDGETTFGLPDLRGQVPIHRGNGHALGEAAGSSSVTLATQQLPQHAHCAVGVSDLADSPTPAGNYLAGVDAAVFGQIYADPGSLVAMSAQAVGSVGGSQPHDNMMPYLAMNFCIAVRGTSPAGDGDSLTPQPYVGEVRMFTGSFAPAGWMLCDGQMLAIAGNEMLCELIGTTYGGDGEESFALPDLRSRVSLHMGTGPDGITYPISQTAGVERETLTTQQIPIHSHQLLASSSPGSETMPGGNVTATPVTRRIYAPATAPAAMSADAVTAAGGSQPHGNVQPVLCINYIISLVGTFPTPA